MKEEKDERPFSELSRAERRAKARKLLFGDQPDGYMGNIWGWRFSLFSFIGLVIVGLLAGYGIYTGKIDMKELEKEGQESLFNAPQPTRPNSIVNDTLK